jgi:putative signal transducing protein
MNLLLRTNDLVLISAVEAILTGANIEYFVADTHTSVMEGSVGAIPRRVMVVARSSERARKLMTDAGLGHALAPV